MRYIGNTLAAGKIMQIEFDLIIGLCDTVGLTQSQKIYVQIKIRNFQ